MHEGWGRNGWGAGSNRGDGPLWTKKVGPLTQPNGGKGGLYWSKKAGAHPQPHSKDAVSRAQPKRDVDQPCLESRKLGLGLDFPSPALQCKIEVLRLRHGKEARPYARAPANVYQTWCHEAHRRWKG